jgi:hypothetical protein
MLLRLACGPCANYGREAWGPVRDPERGEHCAIFRQLEGEFEPVPFYSSRAGTGGQKTSSRVDCGARTFQMRRFI